jgi:hypothetical protein
MDDQRQGHTTPEEVEASVPTFDEFFGHNGGLLSVYLDSSSRRG